MQNNFSKKNSNYSKAYSLFEHNTFCVDFSSSHGYPWVPIHNIIITMKHLEGLLLYTTFTLLHLT